MSQVGQMTAPRWGAPDWRDEGAYPGPDTPPHEWRWQFLRRLPDYRKFWLDRATADFEERRAFAKWVREKNHPDHPLPEWYCGWVVSEGFLGPDCYTPDPSFPHHRGECSAFPPILRYDVWTREFKRRDDVMSVEFDLDKPLDQQIEQARRDLNIAQAARHDGPLKSGRDHVSKWRLYLRVIDARDDEQSWSTIAREILPPNRDGTRKQPQAGRQAWQQAQGLMFKVGR